MTPAENRQHASDENRWHVTPPGANPNRTVLALLRVGSRRCRLAAAFMAVVIGLTATTANVAFAESRRTVLYLDAPAVSKDHALQAGKVADAYADPGSPATRETLAWLGLPVRPADVSEPPEYAEAAFTSLTAPDGDGAGGVTAKAALRAGEVMLAQIDEGVSPGGRDGDEYANEEMAAGAVRPTLGDGTRAPDAERVAKPAAQPEGQPEPGGEIPTDVGTPEYASTPASPDPSGEPGDLSGGASIVIPDPLSGGEEPEEPSTELAAAPSYTGASPEPAFGTEDEPYGPIGPVSDVGERPRQPYPDENNPAAEQPSGEDELAQNGPVEEEPVEADQPAAPPDESTGPDTGPTGEEGDEIALVPVSVRAEGDEDLTEAPPPAAPPADNGSDDFASVEPSPAAEDAPQGSFEQAEIVIEGGETPVDASPGVSFSQGHTEEESIDETPGHEVTIVHEPDTGATVEAAPADESSDEVGGRSGSDTTGVIGQDGLQGTHEPSAGGSGDPTDQPDGADTQPPPEESAPSPTPTAGGPPERADQPGDGAKDPANESTAGDQTPTADETGTRSGDPQGGIPHGDDPQALARTRAEPAGDDTRLRDHPNSGDTRDPGRHDRDASGPSDAGNGRSAGPDDRRTREADGGQTMQERAWNPVGLPEGGGTPSPVGREAELERIPARTERGGTEKGIQSGSPELRISARQTAETQTYTQPEPAVPRRVEQVHREPVQHVAPESLDAAPQVGQPAREAVPTAAAAPEQPVQHAPQGGAQDVQLTETVNRAAGQ